MNNLEAKLKSIGSDKQALIKNMITSVLGEGGLIKKYLPDTEYREAQVDMSHIVADVLVKQKQCAIIEAPTGSGKSLSYSLPAAIASHIHDMPVFVSTSTKNLQGQLIDKDLPLLQKIFLNDFGIDFKYVVCQGRSNYLCLRRLHRMLDLESISKKKKRNKKGSKYEEILMDDIAIEAVPEIVQLSIQRMKVKESLATERERQAFDSLMDWYMGDPKTGDVRDFGVEVNKGAMVSIWEKVCSTSDECLSWKCPYSGSCYFQKAKKSWEKADVCIINHALFFANRAIELNGGTGVLPESQFIIFDEADHVQSSAQGFYGIEMHSTWAVRIAERILPQIGEKGCLYDIVNTVKAQQELAERANHLVGISRAFFDEIDERYLVDSKNGLKRYKEKISVDAAPVISVLDSFIRLFADAETLYTDCDKDKATDARSFHSSFCRYKAALISLTQDINVDENCYFIEAGFKATKYGKKISLKAIPIDVSKFIKKATEGMHCVYTSATLAAHNELNYFAGTLGININNNTVTAILPSPFDYKKNCIVYQPLMPKPSAPEYQQAVIKTVMELEKIINGGIFILFTAYSTMMSVMEATRTSLEQRGRKVLVQGIDGYKDKMIADFRENKTAILFGVTSFWVGVDVRGSALSAVIITKMPFERPDEPINEAMKEFLERNGRSYFLDHDLPKATMMIRQGFGRLIRTRGDYGVVVLLDSRLNSKTPSYKQYGGGVMKSLPDARVVGNIKDVESFFNNKEKKNE